MKIWQGISQGGHGIFAKWDYNGKDVHDEDGEPWQSFWLQSSTSFIGSLIGVSITRFKICIIFSLNKIPAFFFKKSVCPSKTGQRRVNGNPPLLLSKQWRKDWGKRMGVSTETAVRNKLLKIYCPQVTERVAATSNPVPFLISWLRGEDFSNIA